jgi:spore maturation protein CgeB
MKKIFTMIALITALTSCNNSPKLTDQYEVIENKFEPTFKKALIDVKLKRRVTETELKSIAEEIKANNTKAERFMIKYFLEDTPNSSEAWAVTNYNPEEYVSIIGTTEEDEKVMKEKTQSMTNIKGNVLGIWKINETYMERTVTLYKEEKIIKMLSVYPDGSSNIDTLIEKKEKTKTVYYKKLDSPNEYYIIEPNKNLSVFSNNKKFTEAIRR